MSHCTAGKKNLRYELKKPQIWATIEYQTMVLKWMMFQGTCQLMASLAIPSTFQQRMCIYPCYYMDVFCTYPQDIPQIMSWKTAYGWFYPVTQCGIPTQTIFLIWRRQIWEVESKIDWINAKLLSVWWSNSIEIPNSQSTDFSRLPFQNHPWVAGLTVVHWSSNSNKYIDVYNSEWG